MEKLRNVFKKIFHIDMRLFAVCSNCNHRFYISNHATIRSELPVQFYLTCPICHQMRQYTPNSIFAETSESNVAVGGAIAGGLVGLIAGGIGVIVGAVAGALLGGNRERQDNEAVNRFNRSI